jgi:hypothetical protein
MRPKVLLWILLLAVAGWGSRFVFDYFDRSSIGHVAIRDWLRWYGEGVYEFHAKTGTWPQSIEDLTQTTLPVRWPLWRSTADAVVLLWPQDLKDEPKSNGVKILAYYNKGLLSEMGRKWVLFGDLRTEYLTEKDLGERLSSQRATATR